MRDYNGGYKLESGHPQRRMTADLLEMSEIVAEEWRAENPVAPSRVRTRARVIRRHGLDGSAAIFLAARSV